MTFKKLFLFNSHRFFCINYFIDTESLEIEDKNVFTATEVVTLKPTYNADLFKRFQQTNQWTEPYFPNKSSDIPPLPGKRIGFLKRVMEQVLTWSLFDQLEEYCLKTTLEFWKKKFPEMDATAFELALRSKKNVSKHHPNNFQKRVLNRYDEKIRDFERKNKVILTGIDHLKIHQDSKLEVVN